MAKGYNVSYADRPSEVEKINYWRNAFWDVMFNRSYAPAEIYPLLHEIDQLRELNQIQASKIMHLELLLGCFKRVGDTLYIDHTQAQRLYRFFEDTKPFIHTGLRSSKYYRQP
jgi:hypothetical protein